MVVPTHMFRPGSDDGNHWDNIGEEHGHYLRIMESGVLQVQKQQVHVWHDKHGITQLIPIES